MGSKTADRYLSPLSKTIIKSMNINYFTTTELAINKEHVYKESINTQIRVENRAVSPLITMILGKKLIKVNFIQSSKLGFRFCKQNTSKLSVATHI